ncbi:MAG: hypothetical protein AAF558_13610 [Verrucomicrobiota bacterium]
MNATYPIMESHNIDMHWRKKAKELFPDLSWITDDPEESPYYLWTELYLICEKAHEEKDDKTLRNIYGFADWSIHHEDQDTWNSVGVSFYEHIVLNELAYRDLHQWVSLSAYKAAETLFKNVLSEDKFSALSQRFENIE